MTKILKVLGSENCKKCNSLKENIEKIIKEKEFDFSVEKINDIQIIIDYDVMSLPAIVIDEKVVSVGKILNNNEIINLLNK
ncbi:MAG: thioredoxin family protein [Rickettsiales bacterium]|nr:thioredoxin family protein [Rickettsiales bacterium]